jgi:preprotein translocase subunit SecE
MAPAERTVKYIRDVEVEMRKVVWPTRQQLVAYTLALLGSVILGSLFLYLCDVAFHFGLGFMGLGG